MRSEDPRPSGKHALLQALDAAARLVELRAAAIRAGFPALAPETELSLAAEAIRKLASRASDA